MEDELLKKINKLGEEIKGLIQHHKENENKELEQELMDLDNELDTLKQEYGLNVAEK